MLGTGSFNGSTGLFPGVPLPLLLLFVFTTIFFLAVLVCLYFIT